VEHRPPNGNPRGRTAGESSRRSCQGIEELEGCLDEAHPISTPSGPGQENTKQRRSVRRKSRPSSFQAAEIFLARGGFFLATVVTFVNHQATRCFQAVLLLWVPPHPKHRERSVLSLVIRQNHESSRGPLKAFRSLNDHPQAWACWLADPPAMVQARHASAGWSRSSGHSTTRNPMKAWISPLPGFALANRRLGAGPRLGRANPGACTSGTSRGIGRIPWAAAAGVPRTLRRVGGGGALPGGWSSDRGGSGWLRLP